MNMRVRLKHIGDLEHQVARSLVKDGSPVLAAQAIEDREPNPHKRNAESLGRLPPVTVGDQQIAIGAGDEVLEVAEVADPHLFRRNLGQNR